MADVAASGGDDLSAFAKQLMADHTQADRGFNDAVKMASGMREENASLKGELADDAKMQRALGLRMLKTEPPKAPELIKPPEPPGGPPVTDTFKSFGSFATILGVLGSAFSRTPLTTSLNAAAGAMNAYRQNDLKQYQLNMENWKAQSEYAIQVNQWQNQQYQMLMDRHKQDLEQQAAAVKAFAAAINDRQMMAAVDAGDMKTYMDLLDHREQITDKFNQNYLDLLKVADQRRDKLELNAYRKATLDYQNNTAKETARHNTAEEIIQRDQAKTTAEKDAASAAEKSRHDKEMEKIGHERIEAISNVKKQATDKKRTETLNDLDSLTEEIDEAIAMAGSGDTVTGLGGMVTRGIETVKTIGSDSATPASDFQSKLDAIKLRVPKALTGSSKSAKDERLRVDEIVRGLSPGDTQSKTVHALEQLKTLLDEKRKRVFSGQESMDVDVSPEIKALSDDELLEEYHNLGR